MIPLYKKFFRRSIVVFFINFSHNAKKSHPSAVFYKSVQQSTTDFSKKNHPLMPGSGRIPLQPAHPRSLLHAARPFARYAAVNFGKIVVIRYPHGCGGIGYGSAGSEQSGCLRDPSGSDIGSRRHPVQRLRQCIQFSPADPQCIANRLDMQHAVQMFVNISCQPKRGIAVVAANQLIYPQIARTRFHQLGCRTHQEH